MSKQEYILTIAGFDPTNGAGLTADMKTFHAHGLYGLSVCTAVTVQNDIDFKSARWMDEVLILDQITTLFERFEIQVVKIGIFENWQTLKVILDQLFELNPKIKVVLDPVLKASAGYDFHTENTAELLDDVLDKVFMITPNFDEIQALYSDKTVEETIDHIKNRTNLYLKGGHRIDQVGLDQVFYDNERQLDIEPKGNDISPKHGSGCVLSSALASQLALGVSIEEASILSKRYTEKFLSSNTSLLGEHA